MNVNGRLLSQKVAIGRGNESAQDTGEVSKNTYLQMKRALVHSSAFFASHLHRDARSRLLLFCHHHPFKV